MYVQYTSCALSGQLPRKEIAPPVGVSVWFRVSVNIRVGGGQVSLWAIVLERSCAQRVTLVVLRFYWRYQSSFFD